MGGKSCTAEVAEDAEENRRNHYLKRFCPVFLCALCVLRGEDLFLIRLTAR
jgi:hypothetical protein